MGLIEFKSSCFYEHPEIVVQKYLIDGSTYFFHAFYSATDKEFNFKKDLAISLSVHIRDIVIVGSSKLGFSIKPDEDVPAYYPFKKFNHDVVVDVEKEKSDLDIAIVSSKLFDEQLLNICNIK